MTATKDLRMILHGQVANAKCIMGGAWGICIKGLVKVQKEAASEGGLYLLGQKYYPDLANISVDNPEGIIISRISAGTFPCRVCE